MSQHRSVLPRLDRTAAAALVEAGLPWRERVWVTGRRLAALALAGPAVAATASWAVVELLGDRLGLLSVLTPGARADLTGLLLVASLLLGTAMVGSAMLPTRGRARMLRRLPTGRRWLGLTVLAPLAWLVLVVGSLVAYPAAAVTTASTTPPPTTIVSAALLVLTGFAAGLVVVASGRPLARTRVLAPLGDTGVISLLALAVVAVLLTRLRRAGEAAEPSALAVRDDPRAVAMTAVVVLTATVLVIAGPVRTFARGRHPVRFGRAGRGDLLRAPYVVGVLLAATRTPRTREFSVVLGVVLGSLTWAAGQAPAATRPFVAENLLFVASVGLVVLSILVAMGTGTAHRLLGVRPWRVVGGDRVLVAMLTAVPVPLVLAGLFLVVAGWLDAPPSGWSLALGQSLLLAGPAALVVSRRVWSSLRQPQDGLLLVLVGALLGGLGHLAERAAGMVADAVEPATIVWVAALSTAVVGLIIVREQGTS